MMKLVKRLAVIAMVMGFVACSGNDGENRTDIRGSWISNYVDSLNWKLYAFDSYGGVDYRCTNGVEYQGEYQYDNKTELLDINVTNSNQENFITTFSITVTEVNDDLLFDYGFNKTELFTSITPSNKIVGEWRWREGDKWKKYVFKSNGTFDLINESGNQSRGSYTYHKNDKLLVIKTEYAESGSLGEEMFFVEIFKELIILEEPQGKLFVYDNIK